MKLHQNPKDFTEAIQAAGQALSIREVFIEKDYWVCYILKNLSQSPHINDVIFKGGTSLSKAHKVIFRFSEDVDLAILNTSLPDAQLKKKMKDIEKAIAAPPLASIDKKGITSKGSRFRKTVWEYKKTSKGDYGDASPDLLLELNSFAIPSPFQALPIQTYIADFLSLRKQFDAIKEFELESFKVNVLDIKRTLTEKVAAVARASFESDANQSELKKKIRHLYDLTMLLRQDVIKNFISSSQFQKMVTQVQQDDSNFFDPGKSLIMKNFKDAPIYKNSKDALEGLRTAYDGQFATLIFSQDDAPDFKEILKALQSIEKNL